MPSIWYHLMTPPVKSCGCWAGTGWPFTFLWGCRRCLALSRTVSDSRFLMSWLESLIFSISSACSFFWSSVSSWYQMFNIKIVKLNVLSSMSTVYLSLFNLKSILQSKNTSITPSAEINSHLLYLRESSLNKMDNYRFLHFCFLGLRHYFLEEKNQAEPMWADQKVPYLPA